MNMDQKAINAVRFLSIDAIQKANSGHPGLPMGCASIGYLLFKDYINYKKEEPNWINRDRFVLSAGHGSMLLYSLLHLFDYGVSLEDLKNFRQIDSKTPGHPEYKHTLGVETTTGPLGQGIANAVGMAIAQTKLANEFNKKDYELINHYIYCLVGDGDLMEGISSEAASLAGHLNLNKLICFYDDNKITIDGSTDKSFSEDIKKRFESFNWNVYEVKDGNDIDDIKNKIEEAKKSSDKPSMIILKNIIGYGSPNKQGTSGVHGSPLGKEEIELTRKNLSWEHKEFEVPNEIYDFIKDAEKEKIDKKLKWDEMYLNYKKEFKEDANLLESYLNHQFKIDGIDDDLFTHDKAQDSTRNMGGIVLNKLKKLIPNIIGGSADLNASTKTYLKEYGDYSKDNLNGDNIYFGIREHAMGAICNGIYVYGGFKVFNSTFLVFSDYQRPSIRLSALMNIPVVYIFTHDSIAVGEDGPTHQPVEHLMSLRLIPNLTVYRPANYKETLYSYIDAFSSCKNPSAIILTRQNVKNFEGTNKDCLKGAYIVKEGKEKLDLILMGSGSEVGTLIDIANELEEEGYSIRVVSFLSFELFEKMDEKYKNKILKDDVLKISVEAGRTIGWERYSNISIGVDSFGKSGKMEDVFKDFKLDKKSIKDKILRSL
ncbi:transketolase [Peptostreptococcaceae bacterium AGR-M142]